MDDAREYNPLDYDNLTNHCVQELMRRNPSVLTDMSPFSGAGVYALFYVGDFKGYKRIRSLRADWPIYVGKAVPPGARKGAKSAKRSTALYSRLHQHRRSIEAAKNLRVEDFLCRYLVVTPLWITMAERLLIERYQPAWNVCIEGFGLHDPGKGRKDGEKSWWDVLHPGRPWADRLLSVKDSSSAGRRLKDFTSKHRPGVPMPPLKDPSRFVEDEDASG